MGNFDDEQIGLSCAECGAFNNCVLDSRPGNQTVRRRRLCNSCGARWTTYEVAGGKGDEKPEPLRQLTVYLPASMAAALEQTGDVNKASADLISRALGKVHE